MNLCKIEGKSHRTVALFLLVCHAKKWFHDSLYFINKVFAWLTIHSNRERLTFRVKHFDLIFLGWSPWSNIVSHRVRVFKHFMEAPDLEQGNLKREKRGKKYYFTASWLTALISSFFSSCLRLSSHITIMLFIPYASYVSHTMNFFFYERKKKHRTLVVSLPKRNSLKQYENNVRESTTRTFEFRDPRKLYINVSFRYICPRYEFHYLSHFSIRRKSIYDLSQSPGWREPPSLRITEVNLIFPTLF